MKKLSLSIILVVVSISFTLSQYLPEEIQKNIDKICQETFTQGNFPGMSVMIAKKDQVVWAKGYGYSHIENKIPVDPYQSIFRIGSISKTITAAGLAILVESGKVILDNAVQDYVPYFPVKAYPLSVKHICAHTGGIRHYEGMEFMSNIEYQDVASGIGIFKDSDLLFEPGSKYAYSSYGWNLVSAVIEGASGQPFKEYMQEHVFKPIGMESIYAESVDINPEHLVEFYMQDGDGNNVPSFKVNNSYKWAGGGFIASAVDLVKFSYAIQKNELYNQTTKELFWESGKLNDGSKTNYGLGWATNIDDLGRWWVGHSGGSAGGTSMYLLYPEEDLTVITLVNLSGAQMNGLASKIAEQIVLNE